MAPPAVGYGLLVAGLALFVLGWVAYRRRRVMADTPTSKVRALALGVAEVSGVAEPAPGQSPLVARYTGERCLYWSFVLEEERERVVTQVVNGKTVTRTERYWATLDHGEERVPIAVRDETGAVLLDLAGADVPTPAHVTLASRGPFPTPAAEEALRRGGWLGTRPRRLTEKRLPAGTPLYVLADAQRRADGAADAMGSDALVLRKPASAPFLVSDKSEKALTLRWTAAFWAALVVGIGLAAAGAFVLSGGAP